MVLSHRLGPTDAKLAALYVLILWILCLVAQLLSLKWILKKSISPMMNIINKAQNSSTLEEIDPPNNVSYEILSIYKIINDSIKRLKKSQMQTIETERNAALARMVQYLAHDVRKPFSMLKTGLQILLANANDPEKFKSKLNLLTSEIERSTKTVDGMLTDIMEIGSEPSDLTREAVAPEALIESTLGEIFRIYPKSHVNLIYEFYHSRMVHVHIKKVGRLFSNIVGNAVQAMDFHGRIWFKTKNVIQDECPWIEFCIGNDASFIPADRLPRVFDTFFTAGKKSGTGLGLAIAQKVVHAHGGRIWCESVQNEQHPRGKVEFYFTLPVAVDSLLQTNAYLPSHSDEITRLIGIDMHQPQKSLDSGLSTSDSLLLRQLMDKLSDEPTPLRLMIVDDEAIYRSGFVNWIEEHAELRKIFQIEQASGSDEALRILAKTKIDLLISDIDMGPDSFTGFEFVRYIRNHLNFNNPVFMHSNRIVPEDHRLSFEVGADGFLPKPMSKGQLIKLLLHTVDFRKNAP